MTIPPGLKINNETQQVDLDRPVTLVQCPDDAEKLIVKIARVSNQKNDSNWDTGPKLLRYLIKHAHWSPFEHSFLTVRIDTELDIAAQICRHRSMTFSQFSCRYAKTTKALIPEFRRQDLKNRQNSIDDLHPEVLASAQETAQSSIDQAFHIYERMNYHYIMSSELLHIQTYPFHHPIVHHILFRYILCMSLLIDPVILTSF